MNRLYAGRVIKVTVKILYFWKDCKKCETKKAAVAFRFAALLLAAVMWFCNSIAATCIFAGSCFPGLYISAHWLHPRN